MMSGKKLWKDKGYTGGSFNAATPFLDSGHEHQLVNTETKEHRTIHVRSNQTLTEAIKSDEQWTCRSAEAEQPDEL
jgi:hypothetical protein